MTPRAPILIVLAATALAALALVRGHRRPWPRPVPAPPAAVQAALPPSVQPLVPAPLVSRGRRVASSPRGGEVLVDGIYRTKASWAGGRPTPGRPSWAAIDVGAGPTRLLVAWTSSGNHDYLDRKYGAPVDYRLETSADSTNGEDGTWRIAMAVEGNPARTRTHAIDFTGQRWLRLKVTGLSPDVFEWGLYVDELDVWDLSAGGDDVWVFFGDSITSGVFDRSPAHQPGFPEVIHARHPGYFPAAVNAGFGNLHHTEAPLVVDEILSLNPDAKVVALSFGSNDWDPEAFRRDLVETVRRVRAAGRIPIVPRIPYRTDTKEDFAARLNEVVDAVTREEDLLPGPDLYGWFRAHPGRLADGLHPDPAGAVEVIRMWADAVEPLYRR